MVASFLTTHLLIDWRKGARYFTKQLIDHDYGESRRKPRASARGGCQASNHGGWQWTALTGTDSVDVRTFDPMSQASKYDPEATFVREYVTELRDVPTDDIIDWPTLSSERRTSLAPEYPDPIVDRNEGYERAQRVFETALGKR